MEICKVTTLIRQAEIGNYLIRTELKYEQTKTQKKEEKLLKKKSKVFF